LDNTIFRYLSTPAEAAEFISWKQYFLFTALISALLLIGLFLFKLFRMEPNFTMNIDFVPAWIFFAALLIIPVRGGVDLSPIRPGSAYFSNKMFANHSAVNPVWNLIYSTLQSGKLTNQYNFYLPDECDSLFAEHFSHPEVSEEIWIKSQQPNILFILLESFSAGMIHQSFKGKEITPQLNKWIKKSLYFPNTYASGDRTDKGLVSVFSGYPAQPQSSVMMEQKKSEKLPSLIPYFEDYTSVFYYGGDIKFAGMNSYLLSSGFQKIVDKSFFPSESFNAKWGVHDHLIFDKVLADLKVFKQPFVSGILTLSSHPPYDIPVESTWKGIDDESLFLSAAHYTDQSLGNFLDSLSATELWKNLLVVIVSDHGARIPGYHENQEAEKFRIPLLFSGGVILKDSIINKPISQTDIPVTILHQIGKKSEKFIFSKDIFAKINDPYAFYVFNNGMGRVDECGVQIFSMDKSAMIFSTPGCPDKMDFIKIYLQKLMKDYESK
jgi:phosphoglycerol transferase MdoB-like AlkP superfamily enzyme